MGGRTGHDRRRQVRAARKLLGWSQMTLALEAGVDQSTVAKFERGESRPTVLSAAAIKRTLEAAGVELGDDGEHLRGSKGLNDVGDVVAVRRGDTKRHAQIWNCVVRVVAAMHLADRL
jgi:ribosome-binding protein aMBF1 (putative translation factor)